MAKAKTSRKPEAFSPDKISGQLKAGVKTKPHDPHARLADPVFIASALGQCILEGDAEGFKEILASHFEALNTLRTLKHGKVPARTFYDAISPKGNPSLKTIMKLVRVARDEHGRVTQVKKPRAPQRAAG